MNIYEKVENFKSNHPGMIAFRLREHSELVEKNLKSDEKVLYAFCGLLSTPSYREGYSTSLHGTAVVAFTNKRIIIGHKGLLFGHKIKSIDYKKYNDMSVEKGLIWSHINIDTFKEEFNIGGLTSDGASEAEDNISKILDGNYSAPSKKEEVTVEPKRDNTKTKSVVNTKTSSISEEDIKNSINRMAKKDRLLRQRLDVTTDPEERKLIRSQIIANYNEYQKYKSFLDILNDYDKDCEKVLKIK